MDPYSKMKLQETLEEKAIKRFNDYETKRLKMVKNIHKKIQSLKLQDELKFDGENDPNSFNEQSNQKVRDVFRDTRYEARRLERLMNWRDKRYSKYKVNMFEKGTTRRLAEFDYN